MCNVYFTSGTGLYVLVFCRFLPRSFCRNFVGLRCRGMEEWSCFLPLGELCMGM